MKKILFLFTLAIISHSVFAQVADSTKRKVNLQGAVNFRDLGGYTTQDGHHVKWGKIYRSADLSKLTDADLAELKNRKITYDVDLRGTQESKAAPDRLNPNTDYILCPAGSENLGEWMKNIGTLKGNGGDSLMTVFYANSQYFKDRYKPFFDKLLAVPNQESLVFHCSAGKDRTGIGAALLLYSLGVPYDVIVNDYLASDYYRKAESARSVAGMVQLMHIDPEVAKSMLGVKKEYIDASFSAIKTQYGSVDNFLKNEIGLDAAKTKMLKNKFLE
ncbi:tyrosine-protein phosphatase [Mucilaginibacter paludis]|uniref:Protein tyrosine/serine phosphatase n=1 Tax=Mucilaginibacter paludis DSM 18603 TaxID=714943 RepID=H1XZB6_9SPHI|nr:tyrosine-protein phosphatase [Mucilaginibacter paludis]EHQ25604.1 protein tyrosine/serine phosphatase [Mucilaginibacter paludis DSM 18603]